MINRVVLVGRLTADVETRMTKNGTPFARFTLACDRGFSSKDSEKRTDFINCVCWNQSANFIGSYGKKGNIVGAEGRVETGSYTNSEGTKIYTTDILCESVRILESRRSSEERSSYREPQEKPFASQAKNYSSEQFVSNDTQSTNDYLSDGLEIDVSIDDLPF